MSRFCCVWKHILCKIVFINTYIFLCWLQKLKKNLIFTSLLDVTSSVTNCIAGESRLVLNAMIIKSAAYAKKNAVNQEHVVLGIPLITISPRIPAHCKYPCNPWRTGYYLSPMKRTYIFQKRVEKKSLNCTLITCPRDESVKCVPLLHRGNIPGVRDTGSRITVHTVIVMTARY